MTQCEELCGFVLSHSKQELNPGFALSAFTFLLEILPPAPTVHRNIHVVLRSRFGGVVPPWMIRPLYVDRDIKYSTAMETPTGWIRNWGKLNISVHNSDQKRKRKMPDADEPDLVVLLVEDNDADVFLVREAIREQGLPFELRVVADGEKAVQYFDELDTGADLPCPNFMLLDLNLPRLTGDEVLARVRSRGRCASIPVLVLTSSDSPADRERVLRLGADEYFRKPSSLDDFMQLGKLVHSLFGRRWKGSVGGKSNTM
jgi:CheY-like chemotaxis protein